MNEQPFQHHIHLLYVPTLACNLGCPYCYLGAQTSGRSLKQDSARAVATLQQALTAFREAGVLPFNVSLHGGEPTMLPAEVLDGLFTLIRRHYVGHFDELNARGFRKSFPHIKTNLYNFHTLYDLFERHRVSISASIDLPLALHGRYRTTRRGRPWLKQTVENLRLLARYPHNKKISSTLYREHLEDIPALIADIWRIHRELGFDMNNLNFMFGFESAGSRDKAGPAAPGLFRAVPEDMQVRFYEAMREEFTGSELEEGFRRNWFDEFTPSYCTNSFNCGERFYLLQSDGQVWSCVRGQGVAECRYGNILHDPVAEIMAAGSSRIAMLHQQSGLDEQCRACDYLRVCHTGCPVVKKQMGITKSYTCALQKAIYRDNPRSYPPAAAPDEQQAVSREYLLGMHPALAHDLVRHEPARQRVGLVLPNDLGEEKNALSELVEADPLLRALYSDSAIILEINGDPCRLRSQLLKQGRDLFSIGAGDRVALHIKRSLFDANCQETLRNTLHLQLLRDTHVVYGEERRSKQEHLFTHQIFYPHLQASDSHGPDFVMADLSGLLNLHRGMFITGVLNNLFVTTGYLREYHYQKQKANAFYHIQAVNLPFQNLEFYWDE